MKTKVDQYERAARAWPILVKSAKKRETITYGQLAVKMDSHPRVCSYYLNIIQDYCKDNKLPLLQSLAVNQSTGLPGDGFKATGSEDMASIREKVFKHPWKEMKNPFGSYE